MSKEKRIRRISSEEKTKLLQDRECVIKAELLEKLQKDLHERMEQEKAKLEDEDIEIEEVSEDQQTIEIYESLFRKAKSSLVQTSINFLRAQCESTLEAINIEDLLSVESKHLGKATEGKPGGKPGSGSGCKSSGVSKCETEETFKLDRERYLIYGEVQSGKTGFLLGIAAAHILMSRCPVIVILRNCRGDAQQLSNRCSSFIKDQIKYFREQGISRYNTIKYFYVGGDKSEESMKRAIDNCNMIVAIANKTQLNRLVRVLTPETRYATVIDEADSVGYGEDNAEFRQTIHDCVIANSGRTYAITATTFNIIFTEKKITSKNIIKLRINKQEYRGLEKIQMKVIDPKNDTELEDYLKLLSSRDCYEHKTDDSLHRASQKTDHPLIMLIKKYHKKLDQNGLARQVVEVGNWSEVIVYNGDGLTIYSKYISELSDIIKRGVHLLIRPKSVNVSGRSGKWCIVVKAHIDEGLQYYRELHKSTRITHIAIVSDMMASRGISFVSKDYKWHLTTQYYEPAPGATADNIIQSIRLCGNYKDDLPLVLYSTKKVCNDLAKCFLVQEEMLSRCKGNEKVKSIPRILKKMPLCTDKLPKRKFGVQEFLLNKVEGEDGGEPIERYEEMTGRISGIKKSVCIKSTCERISDSLYRRKDMKFGIFLASIDIDKVYSKDSIEKLLEDARYEYPSKFFSAITQKNNSYGPGQIFEKKCNGWKVIESNRKAWTK
jgi:hypothetical protein